MSMSTARPRLAFLLGSGISIPAGMPSTGDITERVLSGRNVMRHTDGTYYLGPVERDSYPGLLPRVLHFLSLLQVRIDAYYGSREDRRTNYEDLYYVASQIVDSESGEYDNPAVQALVDRVRSEMRPVLVVHEDEQWIREDWTLGEIATEAMNYVRDTTWRLLLQAPTKLDHLKLLTDACQDDDFADVAITTLNHDTVLEQWLAANSLRMGVDVVDGFGEPINDVRYWERDLIAASPSHVKILKLHGSVNWFLFRPDNSVGGDARVGIPLKSNIWSTISPSGDAMQWPEGSRPRMLAGTFNKMLEYARGIYADLYFTFRELLRKSSYLVVCGYGFGDKGINTTVFEWLWDSPSRRMLIVHPDPRSLRENARGILRNNWDRLVGMGRLAVLPARVEQASWPELHDILLGITH